VRLLLDTHGLLWWLNDDEELGNLREVLSAILRTTSSSALSPREITAIPWIIFSWRRPSEGAHSFSQDQNVAPCGIGFVTCSDPVVS
jgi:hypothetical protein